MVPPHRRASGGLEPAGRALEPAGRASEPAVRTLEPAGRALQPAGRVSKQANNGKKKKVTNFNAHAASFFLLRLYFFFEIHVYQFVGSGKKNFIDILCFFD